MSLKARCFCWLVILLVMPVGLAGCQPKTIRHKPGTVRPKRIFGTYVPSLTLRDRFWLIAKNEVDRSTLDFLLQDKSELRQGLRRHKFIQGDPGKKWIALTFDDGPHPDFTPEILRVLKKERIKATFFVVGQMTERYPELVRQEAADGHDIGNHTYDHINLTKITTAEIVEEIETCGDVIESITAERPHLFRPPGGDYNNNVALASEALGYTLVLWTDNTGDWSNPGERAIEAKLLRRISNGGVILMHDGYQHTVEVLPQVIEILKRRGYEFVTVDQLMPRSARVSLEADYLNKL